MFELGTFVVSIVAFLIVFWLISRFGFRPLGKMLEQRRMYIETEITEAEQSRQEAETLRQEQRRILEETRNEVKNMLDAARVRADEQAREIVTAAQAEAERLLEEGRSLIQRERTEAMNEVVAKVASLSVELTQKLLHNHVSQPVHDEMLQEAEKRLGELVC